MFNEKRNYDSTKKKQNKKNVPPADKSRFIG